MVEEKKVEEKPVKRTKIDELREQEYIIKKIIGEKTMEHQGAFKTLHAEVERLKKACYRTDPEAKEKLDIEVDVFHDAYRKAVDLLKGSLKIQTQELEKTFEANRKSMEADYQKQRQELINKFKALQTKQREAVYAELKPLEDKLKKLDDDFELNRKLKLQELEKVQDELKQLLAERNAVAAPKAEAAPQPEA
jgi:hypothetical protein